MPIYLQYWCWLAGVSALCFLAERLWPWRREQRALRRGIEQDLVFIVWNGHFLGTLLYMGGARLLPYVHDALARVGLPTPESFALLAPLALPVQVIALLVTKDLFEYFVHRLLHRVSWLWAFHKVHHTIEELDFIGNMRFHAMEAVVYRALTYLPLAALGASSEAVLILAVVSTVIGHLNHANLRFGWGPLGRVINSPRMHVWHHDYVNHHPTGQNFGVMLCLWDYLFGTAYRPADREQPERLGFAGIEVYPRSLAGRFLHPLSLLPRRRVPAKT